MRPHRSQGDTTNPIEGRESVDHYGSGHAARRTEAVESRADYIRRIVDAAPPLLPQQCDQLARLMRSASLAGPEMDSLEERLAS